MNVLNEQSANGRAPNPSATRSACMSATSCSAMSASTTASHSLPSDRPSTRCRGCRWLTKKHPRNVIASQDFVTYCGGSWITIGKEKLRGVQQKLTVLYPDIDDAADEDEAFEVSYDGMSDAEQLMMLLRESGSAVISTDQKAVNS